jgi:4-phosphopantoate---beta-alanine ligase
MRISIPKDHPRAVSLGIREMIVDGLKEGLVVEEGLIAHGRGETFDYLIGEKTTPNAIMAINTAAALLLSSRHPVISVNGNFAALCGKEIIELSRACGAPIEVNLFYHSVRRERAIKSHLEKLGATDVLGVGRNRTATIPNLNGERKRVDPRGIALADTVFVPLEDGDRTEALIKMGKKVIAVDLNPLSRTAVHATICIVDNVVRVIPILIQIILELKNKNRHSLTNMISRFDNFRNLDESLRLIRLGGSEISATI